MWVCGDCGRPESSDRVLDGVCHHCGVLLCRKDRYVLVDRAFSGPLVSANRTAVHCRACWRDHHPAGVPLPLGSDTTE